MSIFPSGQSAIRLGPAPDFYPDGAILAVFPILRTVGVPQDSVDLVKDYTDAATTA